MRGFLTVRPSVASRIPVGWWDSQWEGATLIVENGCKLSGGETGSVGHCFTEQGVEGILTRARLFRVSINTTYT